MSVCTMLGNDIHGTNQPAVLVRIAALEDTLLGSNYVISTVGLSLDEEPEFRIARITSPIIPTFPSGKIVMVEIKSTKRFIHR